MKKLKGEFGYLTYQRKKVILITIILFAISISVYVLGYVTTKTNKNLLTVVSILGLLPASKSAVNMILFIKNKGGSQEVYEKIKAKAGSMAMAYELVLTSYEKTFFLSSVVAHNNTLCGYSENPKCDVKAADKHITTMLSQNGFKITVKIFDNLEKYLERLDTLSQIEEETPEVNLGILRIVKAISI